MTRRPRSDAHAGPAAAPRQAPAEPPDPPAVGSGARNEDEATTATRPAPEPAR